MATTLSSGGTGGVISKCLHQMSRMIVSCSSRGGAGFRSSTVCRISELVVSVFLRLCVCVCLLVCFVPLPTGFAQLRLEARLSVLSLVVLCSLMCRCGFMGCRSSFSSRGCAGVASWVVARRSPFVSTLLDTLFLSMCRFGFVGCRLSFSVL